MPGRDTALCLFLRQREQRRIGAELRPAVEAERLVDALKRLEYRGYDSAGVATINDGKLDRRRAEGKADPEPVKLRKDVPGQ